jgi:hypothetical protein
MLRQLYNLKAFHHICVCLVLKMSAAVNCTRKELWHASSSRNSQKIEEFLSDHWVENRLKIIIEA